MFLVRSHRDSNSDLWIQSPMCSPLHYGTAGDRRGRRRDSSSAAAEQKGKERKVEREREARTVQCTVLTRQNIPAHPSLPGIQRIKCTVFNMSQCIYFFSAYT